MLNYTKAVAYLEGKEVLGAKPGLERVQKLLQRLGNPQDALRCIHVAGTNGKGSACAMLESILRTAGYRTGLYTSPHLESYTERIQEDGSPISEEAFAKVIHAVREAGEAMLAEGDEEVTVFELLTAAAFLYFEQQKVEIVLLETGLGGQFDATNVIKAPLLSLIMSIGMDHMDFLGDTVEKIAREKGGIVKEKCPVVLYSQGELVYNSIKAICEAKNATLYCPKNHVHIVEQTLQHTIFSVENEYISYPAVELSLLGGYQIGNATAVLTACSVLQKRGLVLSEDAILSGIRNAKWPGRMELFGTGPLVVVDGAHNVDGITMLAQSIPQYFSGKKITLILGVLGDKEYERMLEVILPMAERVVLTEPQNNRRLSADRLEVAVSAYEIPVFKQADIEKAYGLARQITRPDQIILCCGSLYMIGEIRRCIRRYLKQAEIQEAPRRFA